MKTLTHQTLMYNRQHCGVIETDVAYSIQYVCHMSILHLLLSKHKLKRMQLLTTWQTQQCIQKTWPLFYIPLHAFKMSKWSFALQPNIPPKLIHSQHDFYSLDTQSGCVQQRYKILIQILHTHTCCDQCTVQTSETQDVTDSMLHHPPLILQMWYLNNKFNVEVPSKIAHIS